MSRITSFVRGNAGRGPAAVTLLTVLLVVMAGCGGGGGGPEKPTAASLTQEGWTAFEQGDLETASARFADALAVDPEYAEAFVGEGWVAVRDRELDVAEDRFDEALLRSAQAIDATAGRVLIAVGHDDPASVRARGAVLLAGNAAYVFTHDRTFSASDVRWFMARGALSMADYPAVVSQLDVLSPGHGLDPASAAFVERAAALLESLRATV